MATPTTAQSLQVDLEITFSGEALLIPTAELIREIREDKDFAWFKECCWRFRNRLTAKREGLLLATRSQLDAIISAGVTASLTFFDRSTTELPASGAPSGYASPITFGQVKLVRWAMALEAADSTESVWFIWLEQILPDDGLGTGLDRTYNATYPLRDRILPSVTTWLYSEVFEDLCTDLGLTDDWDAYAPTGYPYNLVCPKGSAAIFIERLASNMGCIPVMSYDGTTCTMVEPGTDITGVLVTDFTYYNDNLRVMSGYLGATEQEQLVPSKITGNFYYNSGTLQKNVWSDDTVVGRPGSFGTEEYDVYLPYYAQHNPATLPAVDPLVVPIPGAPANWAALYLLLSEFSEAWYDRFLLDPYEVSIAGWVPVAHSTKWEMLEYTYSESNGAVTTLSYQQYLPEFRENNPPAVQVTGAIRQKVHNTGFVTIQSPRAWFKATSRWSWKDGGGSIRDVPYVNASLTTDMEGLSVDGTQTHRIILPRNRVPGSARNQHRFDPNVRDADVIQAEPDQSGLWICTSPYADLLIGSMVWRTVPEWDNDGSGTDPATYWDGSSGWAYCDGTTYWGGTDDEYQVRDLQGRMVIGVYSGGTPANFPVGSGDANTSGFYDYVGDPVGAATPEFPGRIWHGISGNNHPDHTDHFHGLPITLGLEIGGTAWGAKAVGGAPIWTTTEYFNVGSPTIGNLRHGGVYHAWSPAGYEIHDFDDTDNRPPYYVLVPTERIP